MLQLIPVCNLWNFLLFRIWKLTSIFQAFIIYPCLLY
ncbi:mCG146559, isoform CRA_b [Mus musculus]|nr:mCG146559, isoform CRA_b [Mus musculus]